MPTLNKLEYLDETKKQIKSALNTNFNSQITDDDTFRSYVSKIDNIYTNWPKVTGEGTEVNLSNTKKGKMALTPKGNTEQDGEPTPDVPVDVKVVTGDNTINVHGKNLLNISNFDYAYIENNGNYHYDTGHKNALFTNYIKIKSNTNYTMSFSSTVNNFAINEYDNSKNFIQRTQFRYNVSNGTITTASNAKYILISFNYDNSSEITETIINNLQPLFEEGSNATEYQPYQKQEYPLNLGTIELCKIGDYQDYIYKENNKWYKHSEIGKVVLDGSEENLSYNSTANRLQMPFNLQTQDWGALTLTLCDHFTMGDTEIVDGSFNITRTTLFFKNNNLTSLNDWKTWLGSNNTTVYYVLATPTNTEITDTDLINQLESFKSLDNQTNISSTYTSGNAQMIISVAALKKGGN